MNKYVSEAATEHKNKRLVELRRELEERLGREAAAKQGPPNEFEARRVRSPQCVIPAPGSPEHVKMWLHPISQGSRAEGDEP